MFEEINEKIKSVEKEMLRKTKLEEQRSELRTAVTKKAKELSDFKEVLAKEKRDVEVLEKATLTNLVVTLFGHKHEKLYKEQQEYLDAKMKFDRLSNELKELEEELSLVVNKIYRINSLQSEYKKLLDEKKTLIMRSELGDSKALEELLFKKDKSKRIVVELEEAIQAGKQVFRVGANVTEKLKSAKNWGLFDVLGGGGIISHSVKYDKIRDANSQMTILKSRLERFNKEAKDVKYFLEVEDVNISTFEAAADFWFDNIFTDLNVQSKINNSYDSVQNTLHKVRSMVEDFSSKKREMEKDIENYDVMINQIITKN